MHASPLVIVGIGGSGTRVFARLAAASGRNMGGPQNDSNDALALYGVADRWCEPVYRAWRSDAPFPDQKAFEADLASNVEYHRRGELSSVPWGWKQPRSIHLLPALEAAYPGDLRVLHVVRDGRDVAFGNDIHLRLTGSYSIPTESRNEPAPVQLAHLWATANSLAADFGERVLGERYLRVSLEDLCDDTDRTGERIVAFIGGNAPPKRIREIVDRPASIGRWLDADPEAAATVVEALGDALPRFGYRD
jgi:hypothetical protein